MHSSLLKSLSSPAPSIFTGPQVNLDVLSWLLRPVPFVVGLPAPLPPRTSSAPFETTNDGKGGISNTSQTPTVRDREDAAGSGVVPGGGATSSGASGAEEVVPAKESQAAESAPRGDEFGKDPSALGSTPREGNRAVPVPVPRFQRAEDDGGKEGTEGSQNRAGFHSYDETHQVI